MQKIASAPHNDSLSGSPEKRVDIAPDGSRWTAIVAPGRINFFVDRGNGPVYASGSDLDLGQDTAVPSFHIDDAGVAWVSWCQWNRDPQIIKVARGRPTANGWSWSILDLSPGGRVGVDTDLTSFPTGAGSATFIGWTSLTGAYVALVSTDANGTMKVTSLRHGPAGGFVPGMVQSVALEFASTGNGKTPAASPHIFLVTNATTSGGGPLYVHRARFESSGTWTWEDPVLVTNTSRNRSTAFVTAHDGERLVVAYTPEAGGVAVAEWTGSGAVTARTPPALPNGTGVIVGISMAIDPATDDVYIACYGDADGDIIWTRFARAAGTWSAWAVAAVRDPGATDGKVQLVRHPSRDSVDMVWGKKVTDGWDIFSQQLVALTRKPAPPVPLDPPQGAIRDLAKGYSFRWKYQLVSPGDSEAAWAFRRSYGTTTEYWNAGSQSWVSDVVWNATNPNSASQAVFPAGAWENGQTYVWAVATRSSTNASSDFSVNRTVVASTAPALVIVEPVGLIFGTSTPRVTWQITGSEPQRDYNVRITRDIGGIDVNDPGGTVPGNNGLVWDSGVVTSSLTRSTNVGINLQAGIGYLVWVKVVSTLGVSSGWVSAGFTININPPGGPLVELIDEVSYEQSVPRVRLDITARSNFMSEAQSLGRGGWTATEAVRSVSEGDSQLQVEAGMKLVASGAAVASVVTDLGSPPVAASPDLPAPLGPRSFPVTAGQTYIALVNAKTGTDIVRPYRVTIEWYSDDTGLIGSTPGSGAFLGAAVGDQFNIGVGPYTQARVSGRAPAEAKLARVKVEILGIQSAGETFYLSRFSLQPGTSTAWQPGGYSGSQVVQVERSDDLGSTWNVIAERVKPDLYQRASMIDRAMPLGTRVLYRAQTLVDLAAISGLVSAQTLRSESSPVAAISLISGEWVIRDLLDASPLGEVNALVTSHERKDSEQIVVHRPGGREDPIVDYEGQQGAEGTLEVFVPASKRALTVDLLRRGVALLVQSPIGEQLYVRVPERSYATYGAGARELSVNYIEVAR